MPNIILDLITKFQNLLIDIFSNFGALIGFIILFPLTTSIWLWWKQILFKNNIVWVTLEIVPPRETRKSPKAMEQILTSLYSLRNAPGDFFEKWIDGEVTHWFSLETVSFEGEVHFFVRTPIKFRNVIEASFYAHYPDCEVMLVNNYTERFPQKTKDFYERGLDIYGSELILDKNDAYPIRTYVQFEAIEEEQKIDPISGLLENLGKLKKGENIWIQMLIRPADPIWREKGVKLVKELKDKSVIEMPGIETGKKIRMPVASTPGETDIIKAIENSITKPGFDTVIRLIYIAPKTIFDNTFPNKGIAGIFNQYSSMSLNSFKHNVEVRTGNLKWHRYPFFKLNERLEGRKQRVLKDYIGRVFPEELTIGKFLNLDASNFNFFSKSFVLNSEELATIYHLPYYFVLTAPFIQRIESKKTGPPVGLPIFRD